MVWVVQSFLQGEGSEPLSRWRCEVGWGTAEVQWSSIGRWEK